MRLMQLLVDNVVVVMQGFIAKLTLSGISVYLFIYLCAMFVFSGCVPVEGNASIT